MLNEQIFSSSSGLSGPFRRNPDKACLDYFTKSCTLKVRMNIDLLRHNQQRFMLHLHASNDQEQWGPQFEMHDCFEVPRVANQPVDNNRAVNPCVDIVEWDGLHTTLIVVV